MAWLHPLGISNSPGSNAAVCFGQIQAATLSNAHKSSEHPSVVPHIWACILSSSTNQYYGSPKAPAQQEEVLPEIDVHLKLDSSIRLRVQTANTREGGDPTQVTIGPDLDSM